MIKINDRCCIDVDLTGLEFNLKVFKRFKIIESEMNIPIFELQLHQTDYSLYQYLRQVNTSLSITYGVSLETARKYKFKIYNYNYVENGDRFTLILTGILDLKEFTNVPRIKYFEGTSDEVLKQLPSIKPNITYQGNDSQVWIQHNNSDKNFAERIIDHAFKQKDDFILGGLSVDKDLTVISVKDTFKGAPKMTFSNTMTSSEDGDSKKATIDGIKVESDAAYWSNFLSEGKKLPVLSVSDRSFSYMEPKLASIVDGGLNSTSTMNTNFPPIVDNGNCHENYYQAWLDNLNYHVMFMKNNLYMVTSNTYISNDDLKIMELISINLDNRYQMGVVDSLSGKYLVTEKCTTIDPNRGFGHRMRLNRDYTM
ncbi:structural protein [Yersinia phage YerA41]|nr:structural protein [Yersinia phage YerA41]